MKKADIGVALYLLAAVIFLIFPKKEPIQRIPED